VPADNAADMQQKTPLLCGDAAGVRAGFIYRAAIPDNEWREGGVAGAVRREKNNSLYRKWILKRAFRRGEAEVGRILKYALSRAGARQRGPAIAEATFWRTKAIFRQGTISRLDGGSSISHHGLDSSSVSSQKDKRMI